MGGKLGAVLVLELTPCPSQAEQELRVAQTEFDRQAEVTRLLLEGISSTHVSPAPRFLLSSTVFSPPLAPRVPVKLGHIEAASEPGSRRQVGKGELEPAVCKDGI